MPAVRLTRAEEQGKLPAVCMCCGEPVTDRIDHSFPLHPPLVEGPSGFKEIHALRLLFAMAQTPHVTLPTSFCTRHRDYWRLRTILVFGGIGSMIAFILGGLATTLVLLFVFKIDAPWLSCCAIVPLIAYLAAWLTALNRVMGQTLRVQLADDGSKALVLVHVDARYVEALERPRGQTAPPQPREADLSLSQVLPIARRLDPVTDAEDAAPSQSL